MIAYFIQHFSTFGSAFVEHLRIVIVALVISLAIAAVSSYFLMKSEKAANLVIQIFSALYSIPSLAFFAILIPLTGLGNTTAILVLVIYNQYLLLRNIITGLQNVDKSMTEAAVGMGMSYWQVVTTVQVPLALPTIVAGIRLAIVSTTGIATIAASINAGGLGTILFSGMRTMNIYKMIWGALLSMLIAISADAGLKKIEKMVNHKWEKL